MVFALQFFIAFLCIVLYRSGIASKVVSFLLIWFDLLLNNHLYEPLFVVVITQNSKGAVSLKKWKTTLGAVCVGDVRACQFVWINWLLIWWIASVRESTTGSFCLNKEDITFFSDYVETKQVKGLKVKNIAEMENGKLGHCREI